MKSQRQAKIMEIISTRNVETQEQLLAALQQEGFNLIRVLCMKNKSLRKIVETAF